MTGSEALARGLRVLREGGIPDPAGDARRLLAHALGIAPGRLTLALPREIPLGSAEAYDGMLVRRAKRVPVSQIIGRRTFWGRDFLVSPAVLDPRPETETLVVAALEEPFNRVLDLGTGSGCLLVSLLAERREAEGVGIDLSGEALQVAERNARQFGVGDRATFVQGDWFAPVRGTFDLIVSNPPYVAAEEMPGLEPEVRDWEPRLALTDEGDGLDAYRAILPQALAHMAPGARLLLEHGPGQHEAIAAIARVAGFGPPQARRDLDGRARACLLRAP